MVEDHPYYAVTDDKGALLPDDYREFVFETFNLRPERNYQMYGMQELNSSMPRCQKGGRYQELLRNIATRQQWRGYAMQRRRVPVSSRLRRRAVRGETNHAVRVRGGERPGEWTDGEGGEWGAARWGEPVTSRQEGVARCGSRW